MDTFSKFEWIWISLMGAYILKSIYVKSVGANASSDDDYAGQNSLFRFKKRPMLRWLAGIGINSMIVYSIYRCYITSVPAYDWIVSVVDYFGSPNSTSTDCMSTVIASTLLLSHLLHRGRVAIFRSIYSDSTQSLLDALAPVLYNLTAGFVILSEAPPLSIAPSSWFSFSSLKIHHGLGVTVFVLSSYLDDACHASLLNCRKNRAGHVVTDAHKVPTEGLFTLVSCPHFFLEIVSNVALGMILGVAHRPWWILTGYVAVSHVIRAVDRDRWYRATFNNYPTDRKAIIPYIL